MKKFKVFYTNNKLIKKSIISNTKLTKYFNGFDIEF